jgi:segregation and condensation protein B
MTETEQNQNDISPEAQDLENGIRILEALLFASAAPVDIRDIIERMPDELSDDIGDMLKMLQKRYEGHGIELVERSGRWAFRTAEDLAPVLNIEKEMSKKLSRASLETLSIIAYHQPVTRAEIESIRGVATSKGTLDLLMEANWVKPGRRRQVPGRPLTWVTTPHFLDHFGLVELKDLPGMDDLKAAGLLDTRPAIEAMPQTGELFGDDDDEGRKELNVDINVDVDIVDPYLSDEEHDEDSSDKKAIVKQEVAS